MKLMKKHILIFLGAICVAFTSMSANAAVWTGSAGNGSMSDGGNWVGGSAPSAGDALDFSAVTTATTLDADFEDSREFGAVTMGTGVITFTGSLAATSFSDTTKLAIGVDSTVTIDGDLSFSGSGTYYLAQTICSGAVFRVTGDIINNVANAKSGLLPCPNRLGTGEFTIAAKGIVSRASATDIMPQTIGVNVNWEIGEDGISGEKLIVYANINSSARFTAKSDFTLAAPMVICRSFPFDTGNGYTITLGDGEGNGWLVRNGGMIVDGTGKVVCNCVNTNSYTYGNSTYDPYSGPVTVNSGATLEMKPETQLTTGQITVQSGATLALPESGTVTLAGNLRLESGAALSFNFTDAGTAPVLAIVSGKSVTLRDSKTVTVEISGNASTKNIPYTLTTCGGFDSATVNLAAGSLDWAKITVDDNGNLLLEKKLGLSIIIR